MAETEPGSAPSKPRRLAYGGALGLLAGLIAKDMDFIALVPIHGDESAVATGALVLGALLALTRLRAMLALATLAFVGAWLFVAWTPLAYWMSRDLPRRDALVPADAVYVLGSSMQDDGELTSLAESRLLHGLRVLGEGWAPRLILPELAPPYPSYRDAACEVMMSLGLGQEVLSIGPVGNTHDEAVAVAALARELALDRIIVVTSPAHSRRASAAFEAAGVRVVSSPAPQTLFDYESLEETRGDQNLRAFGFLAHEHIGVWYYGLRGWLTR